MAPTSDVGHAKNVAHFQDLISFCQGYGLDYTPEKNSLKIPQLIALVTTSKSALSNVIIKNTAYNHAINERINSFDSLKSLSLRLVSALQQTEATEEKVNDAIAVNKKIHGKKRFTTSIPVPTGTPAPTTINASQQSYNNLIDYFSKLILILESEPSYAPIETDLRISSLLEKKLKHIEKNENVSAAYAEVVNARLERNEVLYHLQTGLLARAMEIKKYIKSNFGAKSEQYIEVKQIPFKRLK